MAHVYHAGEGRDRRDRMRHRLLGEQARGEPKSFLAERVLTKEVAARAAGKV
jgi:hypothetical protein